MEESLENNAVDVCDLVTNMDSNVYAIHGLSGMIGAVMARYSRAETGLRETLEKEFIKEGMLNPRKAAKLIERVLIAYGDDSVGELEGAHISFEDISMLATKVIEHRRIGGSPIEQSTRYVEYHHREDGVYRYFVPPELDDHPKLKNQYIKTMDTLFDWYGETYEKLKVFLETKKPIEEAEYALVKGEAKLKLVDCSTSKQEKAWMRTYSNDLKTKACDILRCFLPLATKTNVGIFGNGRYLQNVISKLLTENIAEFKNLGQKAFTEASKVVPQYVKRAKRDEYLATNRRNLKRIGAIIDQELDKKGFINVNSGFIGLIEPNFNQIAKRFSEDSDSRYLAQKMKAAMAFENEIDFVVALIYSYCSYPYDVIKDYIYELPQVKQEKVINVIYRAYYGSRKTRRNRPERAIEHGYPYQVELVTEWAVYKDLMRHRMGTMQTQSFSNNMGFEMPDEIMEVCKDEVTSVLSMMELLKEKLKEVGLSDYAVLQGHRVRWLLEMNDRAIMHMIELRTQPAGHTNYRIACQKIHGLLPHEKRRENIMVDKNVYFWSRAESESRQRQKEAELED